mmetsp:Transcript_25862/g.71144  ORF Transcript_25862/g.71144 Transcript_25862/m.71144 type:complete len:216 (-) Transcript_25862:1758-2405(-)
MKVSAFVVSSAVEGVLAMMVTWYMTEESNAEAHMESRVSLASTYMKNTAWFSVMIISGGPKTERARRPSGRLKTTVKEARPVGPEPPMQRQVTSFVAPASSGSSSSHRTHSRRFRRAPDSKNWSFFHLRHLLRSGCLYGGQQTLLTSVSNESTLKSSLGWIPGKRMPGSKAVKSRRTQKCTGSASAESMEITSRCSSKGQVLRCGRKKRFPLKCT